MPESMKNNFPEGSTAPPALSAGFALREAPAASPPPWAPGMEGAGARWAQRPLSPAGNTCDVLWVPLQSCFLRRLIKQRRLTHVLTGEWTLEMFKAMSLESCKGSGSGTKDCDGYDIYVKNIHQYRVTPAQSRKPENWWRALCVMQSTWMMCVHTKICSALLVSSPLGQLDLICHFPAKILLLYLSTWPFFKEILYDSPVLT